MTPAVVTVPLALQALAMGVDEFHFHRARGLSRWERVGHPVDTLVVVACYAITLIMPPGAGARYVYCALAAVSCILVTKDEPLHATRCAPWEHWLHSVLFVLHPIVLGCVYWLWYIHSWVWLTLEAAITLNFGLYQAIYWNTSWLRSNTQ